MTNGENGSALRGRRAERRGPQIAGAVVAVLLATGFLASCGDDSGDSSEDAYCDAADSLRTDIDGITDIDLVGGGTDAITAQYDAIKSDVEQLQESGSEVAADEIDSLDDAVSQLGDAIDALGDDISVQGASDAITAAAAVVTSAGAVLDTLTTTCS